MAPAERPPAANEPTPPPPPLPPHTPAEAHHIPGYSGHVPGVYAENLYAQTYGKTTLRAIEGNFPKGCDQTPDEQYKTNTQVQFSDEYSHPGKPTDILHGGASWAGGSPYAKAQLTSDAADIKELSARSFCVLAKAGVPLRTLCAWANKALTAAHTAR